MRSRMAEEGTSGGIHPADILREDILQVDTHLVDIHTAGRNRIGDEAGESEHWLGIRRILNTKGGAEEEGPNQFAATTANSILTSSFTLTVPPAMLMGFMSKVVCFKDAEPR